MNSKVYSESIDEGIGTWRVREWNENGDSLVELPNKDLFLSQNYPQIRVGKTVCRRWIKEVG